MCTSFDSSEKKKIYVGKFAFLFQKKAKVESVGSVVFKIYDSMVNQKLAVGAPIGLNLSRTRLLKL